MATRRFISQLDRLSECQRENEAKADDLKAYAAQASRGRVLDASNAAVVSLRRAREAAVIEYESEMERRSVKKAADDQERARRESEEATLAAELGRARADADAKRREVTAILATDPGLRDLQEKLKLAYVIRARKEQLMEKEVLATREADVVKIADIEMEVRRQDALQQEKLKREALRQQYLAGRKQLEVQLTEKQKRDAASAAAESAAERALVAQIVLRIQQEDVADASARSAAREATRGIIEKYRAHHEHEKAAARAAEIEEGRNMRAWLEAQDVRNAEMQRSRAADAAAKEVAYAAVVAENGATRKKAEEEDQLRWLLVEEETERRRVEEEKARAVAVESSRREMMAANEQQRRYVHLYNSSSTNSESDTTNPSASLTGPLAGAHQILSTVTLCCRLREELAARESAKEAAMIEQFLAKCVEDDRKDAMAKNARLEARTVRESRLPAVQVVVG